MRKIKVPIRYRLNIPAHTSVCAGDGISCIDAARDNANLVIASVLSFEQMMKDILMLTLFREVQERKEVVLSLVLDSDWCTYSSLKKLLLEMVKHDELLDGSTCDKLDKLLSKAMRYRNAFTHGQLASDGTTVTLSYFQGSPKSVVVDDSYLSKIETDLIELCDALIKLQNKLAPKQPA